MPFNLIKDSLWGKVSELQSTVRYPAPTTSKCPFAVAGWVSEKSSGEDMSTKQGCLFVKAALKKCFVLPMSLFYHGYRKTLTGIFQSCHPLAIILVKENERPHIFTVWLQRVQLEIAVYVSMEIFKGNTQGASSFLS